MLDRSVHFIEQEHILERAPQVFVMANNATAALADQEKIERKGGMRLTTIMKESILNKVYDFKFKKAGDKLDAKELQLSHRAMVQAFGQRKLDMLAEIGLPYALTAVDGYGEPLTGEELDNWRGTKVTWRVGASGYSIVLHVKDPLPSVHGRASAKYFVVKPGTLADAIQQWQQDCTEWVAEKRTMQTKVNAVLNSVTTFNSLQKTWPGGERFYKHLPVDFPFRNQVPAVRVEELNAALGL